MLCSVDKAQAMSSNAVLNLVQSLAPAVAYKESNLESNKKVWDLYARVSACFCITVCALAHSPLDDSEELGQPAQGSSAQCRPFSSSACA